MMMLLVRDTRLGPMKMLRREVHSPEREELFARQLQRSQDIRVPLLVEAVAISTLAITLLGYSLAFLALL